jgi:hypothetical protein
MSDTNGVLHVGIDLGTSHSAISASNGARHVVDSYVGWPVDMVARKVLKKSVLIGREALENRTMLDLRRPLGVCPRISVSGSVHPGLTCRFACPDGAGF